MWDSSIAHDMYIYLYIYGDSRGNVWYLVRSQRSQIHSKRVLYTYFIKNVVTDVESFGIPKGQY